jgi:hypothetical protein
VLRDVAGSGDRGVLLYVCSNHVYASSRKPRRCFPDICGSPPIRRPLPRLSGSPEIHAMYVIPAKAGIHWADNGSPLSRGRRR